MNTPHHTSDDGHRAGRSIGTGGFTLVELLIAVAVVAILLAVALPSFMESIRKGRRADAFAAMAALQQAQERWRSNNTGYTATLSDLSGITPIPAPANYVLSVGSPSSGTLATGYVVSAAGRDGTTQASDGECRKLSMLIQNGSISYGSCSSCSSFTYTPTNACWSR